ncbi:MAG: hypothetical protein E7372_05265 [Clostridiales bacterium]|nr:hypothetical protein [Clostridiales bacterium]
MKSKVVSLSAISASFIAVALIIGTYFELADLFMLVVASIFVLLPLYLNSYKGSFLAFLVGGIIAILISGFNFTLIYPAYFGFFGIYPIIKMKMLEKRVSRAVNIIVGIVWFLIISYICYYYYLFVLNGVFEGLPYWLEKYIVYFIGLIAIIFFFFYDRFVVVMKYNLDKYLSKIVK